MQNFLYLVQDKTLRKDGKFCCDVLDDVKIIDVKS